MPVELILVTLNLKPHSTEGFRDYIVIPKPKLNLRVKHYRSLLFIAFTIIPFGTMYPLKGIQRL